MDSHDQSSLGVFRYPETPEMKSLWGIAMLAQVRTQFLMDSGQMASADPEEAIQAAKAAIRAYKLAAMAEIDQIVEPSAYSRANLGRILACTEFYRGAPWLGDLEQELNHLADWARQQNLEEEFWHTVNQIWRRDAITFLEARAQVSEPGATLTETDFPETVVESFDDSQLNDTEGWLAKLSLMSFWLEGYKS
jgi:hypothetical protein